jgi:hypothetical protein
MHLLPMLTQLVTKPETQQMGQQIVEKLVQKAIARFIRSLLLESQEPQNEIYNYPDSQKALQPAAAFRSWEW